MIILFVVLMFILYYALLYYMIVMMMIDKQRYRHLTLHITEDPTTKMWKYVGYAMIDDWWIKGVPMRKRILPKSIYRGDSLDHVQIRLVQYSRNLLDTINSSYETIDPALLKESTKVGEANLEG